MQFESIPIMMAALLAGGVGAPIPEDAVLLAGGAYTSVERAPWLLTFVLLYASAVAADCIIYGLARRFGESWLQKPPLRWLLTGSRRAHVRALFERFGARAVFVGRHITGFRVVVFALAGLERVSFRAFLFWDCLGALLTMPALFAAGYIFSAHVESIREGVASVERWLAVGAALLALSAWLLWQYRRR